MTSLYLCYQSILDPLTQTQVVAYLEGLVNVGYRIVLLTFEPRALTHEEQLRCERGLQMKGIIWRSLRYHKRPRLPATGWDILAGIAMGLLLVKRHKVNLLHARVHVPGVMALVLKRLTGAKLLFDIRGFMAEEYADAGVWAWNSLLFRITKRAERAVVKAADAIIVLTEKGKAVLLEWYPMELEDKLIQVIPCCVDLRGEGRNGQVEAQPEVGARGPVVTYVGKLGGWYMTEEMVAFVAKAREALPGLRWEIWTQSDASHLASLLERQRLSVAAVIRRAPPDALAGELPRCHIGLSFRAGGVSKRGACPTKVGEYLAAGIVVVTNPHIGDMDTLLAEQEQGPVGVLVEEFTDTGLQAAIQNLIDLLAAEAIRDRCRAVAKKFLDLERVGWARYRQIYESLIGVPRVSEEPVVAGIWERSL